MNTEILFVDDDPEVLAGFRRSLRKEFKIDTAEGGAPALALMRGRSPYAVVVVDMRMPAMNGVEFLMELEKTAPDTIRMMLTGNADQKTARDAVNQGHIFRFLTKP
jgi:DNA-binding NtrC family response regulator